MTAEAGVMCPQAKDSWQHQMLGRGHSRQSLEPPEGASHAHTWTQTSGLQTTGEHVSVVSSPRQCFVTTARKIHRTTVRSELCTCNRHPSVDIM